MDALRFRYPRSPRVGTSAIVLSIILAACGTTPSPQPATEPDASKTSIPPTTATPSAPATPSPSPAGTPTIGAIVPEAVFPLDGAAATFQVTDDAVWAFDLTGVLRVDPVTNTSTHLPLTVEGGGPSVLGAIDFNSVWVSDFELGQVRRYTATAGELEATIETRTPAGVLATGDGVWIANHRYGTVSQIDAATNKIAAQIEVGPEGRSGPSNLIEAGGAVWVGIPNVGMLQGIDPAAFVPSGEIRVSNPGGPCGAMATYGSRIYIGGCVGDNGMEVTDFEDLQSVARVAVDGPPTVPVMIDERLWFGVAAEQGGSLMHMDPEALEPVPGPPIEGGVPTSLAIGFDSIWIGIEGDGLAWLVRLPTTALPN